MNPMGLPAATLALSAVLVMPSVGQLTTIDADEVLSAKTVEASLVAVARAVLLSVPQLVELVVAVTCTWISAVGASVLGPHVRTRVVPLMAQLEAVVLAPSTDQVNPAGRVSVMVTPVAVPVPLLTTLMR